MSFLLIFQPGTIVESPDGGYLALQYLRVLEDWLEACELAKQAAGLLLLPGLRNRVSCRIYASVTVEEAELCRHSLVFRQGWKDVEGVLTPVTEEGDVWGSGAMTLEEATK